MKAKGAGSCLVERDGFKIHSHLKFCKNCEKVSALPASGTMMLIIIPDVSTDVLLTFIKGPKGLNSVTWRKLLESSLAKKSS